MEQSNCLNNLPATQLTAAVERWTFVFEIRSNIFYRATKNKAKDIAVLSSILLTN